MLEIPPISSSVWTDLVTGKIKPQFEFMALKIKLGTLTRKLTSENSPEDIAEAATEIREIFVQNINLPKIQNDLNKLMG